MIVKEVKYGVISDVHQDPRIVPVAIKVLKNLGAEKLLVNGDIGNRQRTIQETQNYVAFILDAVGKSGLESFVQPGSHETLLGYGPVIDHFAEQYDNIFDCQRITHIDQEGHQLVFLPGSDFLCGGEYSFGNDELPSGRYIRTQRGLLQFDEFNQYAEAIQNSIAQGAIQQANINDLRRIITFPEKSIVVCHVPRKFDGLENCVDMAESGEVTEDFILQGNNISKGSIFPLPTAKQLADANYPINIKKKNAGNEDLKNLYEELGIKKVVSGHFHESGHRANDRNGNHVEEGRFTNELFWNSGYLDVGQTGILTVKGEEVSYQNVRLQDYLR